MHYFQAKKKSRTLQYWNIYLHKRMSSALCIDVRGSKKDIRRQKPTSFFYHVFFLSHYLYSQGCKKRLQRLSVVHQIFKLARMIQSNEQIKSQPEFTSVSQLGMFAVASFTALTSLTTLSGTPGGGNGRFLGGGPRR